MEREDKESKEQVHVAQWVRTPKDDYNNHPSCQSLIKKHGQMPCGYWNLDGWKGYNDATALYTTYIGNGKKLPEITDPAATATGLQVDGLQKDPMETILVGAEVGSPDDDNAEDLQSTSEDSINRLIGYDNLNKEGELGEIDALADVYQDILGETASNEGSANTNRLINWIRSKHGEDHVNAIRQKN